jgi:hypothetical protein
LLRLDVDKENDASSQVDADETEIGTNEIDAATTASLLETCVIVWEGIKDQLDKVCSLLEMGKLYC